MTCNNGNIFKFFLMIILVAYLFAQTEEELNNKIDSVNNVINLNNSKIEELKLSNENHEQLILNYQVEIMRIKDIVPKDSSLFCIKTANLYVEPELYKCLSKIECGEKVEFLEKLDGVYPVYKIRYNDVVGYVLRTLFLSKDELVKLENEKREKEKLKKEKELKWQKEKEKRQDENAEKQKKEIEKAERIDLARKELLIETYGKTNGIKIYNNQIWIGMTKQMAIDSIGRPNDINKSVYSWGVHEQWVYPNGKYLYFENGKLTSWQE